MVRQYSGSSGRRASAGFTLVELLVVISIIGMLMALLLPAVQSARETGRRNTCQNNAHNVSLALLQFNDNRRAFPGWNNWLNQSATSLTANQQFAEGTYILPLLPYLDSGVVYGNYTQYLNTLLAGSSNSNQVAALASSQVYMANLVCPSNPPPSQTGATPLAYVINGGEIPTADGVPVPQSTTTYTAAQLATVTPASGIAFDQTGQTNATGVTTIAKVNLDYVNSHDGTTQTLLLSENTLSSSSWSLLVNGAAAPSVNSLYVAAITTASKSPYVQQLATTFMWANSGTVSTSGAAPSSYFSINGDKNNTSAADYAHARPASNHPGVCVFAFCGGNVRTIAEDVDYRVYKQLMTPSGGATITATSPLGSGDMDSMTNPADDSRY